MSYGPIPPPVHLNLNQPHRIPHPPMPTTVNPTPLAPPEQQVKKEHVRMGINQTPPAAHPVGKKLFSKPEPEPEHDPEIDDSEEEKDEVGEEVYAQPAQITPPPVRSAESDLQTAIKKKVGRVTVAPGQNPGAIAEPEPPKARKPRKPRDPNAPPRKLSGWQEFMKSQKWNPELKGLDGGSRMKKLSLMYKEHKATQEVAEPDLNGAQEEETVGVQ